ncbi:hypothetical protein GCM10025867_05360 [Frondihabitans sucicola]|uniref:Uncharacterized protein n=1 Tax=Frondihabitans sucicola TaxID=1268041 RepID=A0ABN6XTI7_9MICO|nr:hypothetical protein GCM10025867_05360 [Frondihabitans sucicola]
MPSQYESNDSVPAAKIGHYPARSPQPHLGVPAVPEAPKPELEVSYDELMITAAIDLQDVEQDSEAS